MKLRVLVFLNSLAVAVAITIVNYYFQRSLVDSLITFLITIVTSFIVFYYLIERYIYSKIKLIYKLIHNLKLGKDLKDALGEYVSADPINDVEQEVKEWAKDKKIEIETLKSQEKFRREFLSNVSHEFKTPLTLIMGPIEELMEKGAEGRINVSENLSMIRKNAMRLLRLVNQLMDFRKIEDRKMLVKASELDVVDFIADIMTAFERLAQKRKMDFQLITDHKQLYAWFDPDMIDKVIFNLLSNAFKFTNDRGKIYVRITIDDAHKNVVICIEDNGLGMSEEHIRHAFDRFYTGENLTGNGIGLSLSKEFIELHHGELVLTSEKGRGTRFCIMLPFGTAHFDDQQLFSGKFNWQRNSSYDFLNEYSLPPQMIESHEFNSKKDYTLLLIDDNSELRQFVKNRLQAFYNIEEAHDGATGLRLAFEIVPDLIICDVMLPGKDGFEVVKTVKEDLRTSHIPTIILTAKGSIEQRIVGIQSGADEYITKPFVLEYLHERIKALIRSREQLKDNG